jgi:uncharacterized protein (DUF885 family)
MRARKSDHNATTRNFHRLARDYYMQTFERHPVWGSSAGLEHLNSELGRATRQVVDQQSRLAQKTLRALEAMPAYEFTGEHFLDRLTLRSHLRREVMMLDDLQTWRINPQIYLNNAAEGIHWLLVRNADNLKPVADAIVSRLRQIPKYLDEAIDCVERPVPLWARLTQESAEGVASLLKSLPEPLEKVTKHDRKKIQQWAKEASRAVHAYARRVSRKAEKSEQDFAIGRERFEALIRDRLGIPMNAPEAVAAAEGLAANLKRELKIEARKFHPRKSPAEILHEASLAWDHGAKDLLGAYRKTMRQVRAAFRQAGAVSFPAGESLQVKLVPDFMVHQFPTAAYSSPGALEKDQTGIFWVNDLSLRKEKPEAKRREIAQHFGMELTSAHEAYPGHHLQFVTQHRHPSLVRKLADHSIYYEGWTLWCEQMMIDLKISKNPYLRLAQLNDALWRANRIIIDCGLQTGALTYDGACKRLMREVGFTRARAEADVNWYTSSPTIPMSYLLGKMELMRLKRIRVDQWKWPLRKFNDWVLGFGAIPWSWIEASGL